MNTATLKQAAFDLRKKLEFYKSTDSAVLSLYEQMKPLILDAENEIIHEKLEPRDIPGYKLLADTDLQQYDDLSKAYSKFYVELTDGRSTKAYQVIQEMMKKTL